MLKTALELGLSDRQFRAMLMATPEEAALARAQTDKELEIREVLVDF